ncbi:MAG TPA: apolipoprotein N-acyltransferase [Allosphingosinicella sp.]|jgi:apolipoprotein N-acyltransferase|nr:apolipoprotein N-acyltransferase [Allosphingosinicella sp.]
MKAFALSFIAGAAGAFGFAPVGWWPLSLLAFAALLLLVERAASLRSALARGWWFGVGHFTVGLNWIATAFTYQAAMPAWLGWVAVVLLSLYLAVYPAAAAGLAWRWGRQHPLAFTFAFAGAWIVTEWLRATLFTGFAWNPAGVVLLNRSVAPFAAVAGTYGLSGIVILFAGLIRIAAVGPDRRPALVLAGAALAAQLVAWVAAPEPRAGESAVAVRIVQPNIGQEQKWSPEFAARNLARLGQLSQSGTGGPRLLIWPEAAVTEPLQDERRLLGYQEEVAATNAQVRSVLAPRDLLLTGGITVRSSDGIRSSSATNSVFAIDPAGRILARYDKAHLVPYGEYLPMRPILSAVGLSRLAPGDLDFDPGPGPRTLDLPGVGPVGFQLCYEMIFSGEVVDRARRPGFIFNPSNDAWFGAWGPPQHLAQARLRALEEGLPVIRATPTGVSAVIDARGRLLHSIPLGQAGVIDARLPLPAPPTLFARFGNPLPFAFALLLAAAAIAVRRKAR